MHSDASQIEFRFPNSGESYATLKFAGSIDDLCLEVSRAWYNQVSNYDFEGIKRPGFKLNKGATEFFTQWVW
jgi:hypothetical protein